MDNFIAQRTKLAEKQRQHYQAYRGPTEGIVSSIGPFKDTMTVAYGPNAGREMPIQHPFIGSTSWLRSVPDAGTKFLIQLRGDSEQATPINTLPIEPEIRTRLYNQQVNLYRSLTGGEHDFMSKGFASIYLGEMGHLDMRSGGGVRAHFDKLNLEHLVHTPTHKKTLLFHTAGQMGDEERLGIVKRWQDAVEEKYIRQGDSFQAERFLKIKNPAGEKPAILVQEIEGQIYDDSGNRVNHALTNIPLRHQKFRYTHNDQIHRTEIDESGNTLIQLPDVATEGFQRDIPKGNSRENIGLNREIFIGKDEFVTVKENVQYSVGATVKYEVVKEVVLNSSENILELNPAAGQEKASLTNKQGYGLISQNASDKGFTRVVGPNSSTITMNGQGEIIAQTGNTESMSLTKGMVSLVSSATVQLKGKDIKLDGSKVYLGEGAAIPAVLGLSLQMYMDQHRHPGVNAPTVPSSSLNGSPMSILSTNVYLKPNL